MKTRLIILLTFVFAVNTYAQKSTRIELKKDKNFTTHIYLTNNHLDYVK